MTRIPTALTVLLESAINHYLSLDPDTPGRLRAMDGRVVALHLSGLDVTLFFLPATDHLQVLGHYDGEADAHIAGTPLALAGLLAQEQGARMPDDVTLVGDVQLARQFNDLLRRVDLDWEELLSRFTGDLVAHRAGRAMNEFQSWFKRTAEAFRADVSEYLQEESGTLPTRLEVEHFMDRVDTLRSDADRLEARLRRLENRS